MIEKLEKMLICRGEDEERLYAEAKEIKNQTIGNKVYLRGLIEISNICTKDCFYCGIRKSNTETASRRQISRTRTGSVLSCFKVGSVPTGNSRSASPVY